MSMTQILIGLGGIAVAGALYYMIKEDKSPKDMAKDAKRAAKRELNHAEDKAKSAKDKVSDTINDARDKVGDKIKGH